MKRLCILGSTGSIGTQTLDVVERYREDFEVVALAAGSSVEKMEKQIRQFRPKYICMGDEKAAADLKARIKDIPVSVLSGMGGLIEIASEPTVDIVVTAVVGMMGIRPTLAAIEAGKDIALANKETLVTAGHLIIPLAKKRGISILPVDSEHSAIFQSLRGGRAGEVKRLLITASGGPFRGLKRSQLAEVTLAQCLRHPNWSMGRKITVDSSTLANKGLEVIEAHWLFDMPYDKISVVVHPQSVVHSLVEFADGSVIGQLGEPDMRLPIQYALSWPERYHTAFDLLDLVRRSPLTFEEPDTEAFPSLKIAVDCGRAGGTLPCVFNAANEEAVYAFLDGKIKYLDIPYITAKVTELHRNIPQPVLEEIELADGEARRAAREIIARL